MHSHPNARLTQPGRLRLVIQHLEHGRSLTELTVENWISLHWAYRWLARYRSGGPASLADRRIERRTNRRMLDPQQLQQTVELRHQRLHPRHLAPGSYRVMRCLLARTISDTAISLAERLAAEANQPGEADAWT